MAMAFLRAKFCRLPVTNACGKNNPLIQNIEGVPYSIHVAKKFTRKINSSIHEPNGFKERKPFEAQSLATWLSKILLESFYKS